MKKLTILVACGAGIATSTVVMKKIEDLFKEHKLDADFYQIKISEASAKQDSADMLISTTVLPTQYSIPAITAMPFLTGIGEDKLKTTIVDTAKQLINS